MAYASPSYSVWPENSNPNCSAKVEEYPLSSIKSTVPPASTNSSIASISEVVYPEPSESSITFSSPVNLGSEIVSFSTPDIMKIASSG